MWTSSAFSVPPSPGHGGDADIDARLDVGEAGGDDARDLGVGRQPQRLLGAVARFDVEAFAVGRDALDHAAQRGGRGAGAVACAQAGADRASSRAAAMSGGRMAVSRSRSGRTLAPNSGGLVRRARHSGGSRRRRTRGTKPCRPALSRGKRSPMTEPLPIPPSRRRASRSFRSAAPRRWSTASASSPGCAPRATSFRRATPAPTR